MYLYAFPIQQSLQAMMPNNRSAALNFVLATPLTFVAAVISWYGVERYFIKKKHTKHAQDITHAPAEAVRAGA
jgi:peptidoglycan/LPS O-acetylase OafA/YrhL